MIAAQLFEKVQADIPNVRDLIRRGEFKPIKEWLNRNIHEIGSLYASPDELLVKSTGKPLDPNIYTKYLNDKYVELYSLNEK
jgi:carboxypeptidase Taq